MLKMKLQYFSHLMWRTDSLEKTLMLGKIEGRRRRQDEGKIEGRMTEWDGWMASLTQWTWFSVNSRSWWWTGSPGVLQYIGSQGVGQNWPTKLNWSECMYIYDLYTKRSKIFFLATLEKQYSPLGNNISLLRTHELGRKELILLSHLHFPSRMGDFQSQA